MCITYYDKEEKDFKHINNVDDMVMSLDYETGLFKITYRVHHIFLTIYTPITATIAIDDEK